VIVADIEPILKRYPDAKRDALIPILQDIQESLGYLSREAVIQVGRHLGLSASKVYGVATFYNQFRFQAPGEHHVQVCRGTACHVKSSLAVLEAVQRALNIEPGQTTRDGLFSLEVVACLGVCGLSPVMTVEETVYAGVTPESVKKILKSYRKEAPEHAATA
jgi:NADH-quinone oxidoreductase subunit E